MCPFTCDSSACCSLGRVRDLVARLRRAGRVCFSRRGARLASARLPARRAPRPRRCTSSRSWRSWSAAAPAYAVREPSSLRVAHVERGERGGVAGAHVELGGAVGRAGRARRRSAAAWRRARFVGVDLLGRTSRSRAAPSCTARRAPTRGCRSPRSALRGWTPSAAPTRGRPAAIACASVVRGERPGGDERERRDDDGDGARTGPTAHPQHAACNTRRRGRRPGSGDERAARAQLRRASPGWARDRPVRSRWVLSSALSARSRRPSSATRSGSSPAPR